MTLFDAIRAIKPGQEARDNNDWLIRWPFGSEKATFNGAYMFDLGLPAYIIDLPRPKTLREVVVEIGGGTCRTCAWERQSCEKDANKSCYNGHWLTLEKALAAAGVDLEQVVKEGK